MTGPTCWPAWPPSRAGWPRWAGARVDHAGAFGWSVTAARTLDVYAAALGATAAALGGRAADPLAVGD